MIGFDEALEITLASLAPLGAETLPLSDLAGRVLAEDVPARVDSPSVTASLKDGFAVMAADIVSASKVTPVRLRLVGAAAAGHASEAEVAPGTAVRVRSGAPIPTGADAVLADEYAREGEGHVMALADAGLGRNITRRGSDVARDVIVARTGERLRPARVGLLAAAGWHEMPVVSQPRVAILATGDEVVAPGQTPRHGQLFASNLVTLQAWCHYEGMATHVRVLPDEHDALRDGLLAALKESDVVLTSGGAWKGDRDLVAGVLDGLGWEKLYHRVRLGPGKAVGFGLREGRAVFILPGGPPSNQMAFLQLALPGLHRLAGRSQPGLPTRVCRLTADVMGQRDWTQFLEGRFVREGGALGFEPRKLRSRLQSMADCEGYLKLTEGTEHLAADSRVCAQILPFVTESQDDCHI
jgi:molybdopterin molybdotransferase